MVVEVINKEEFSLVTIDGKAHLIQHRIDILGMFTAHECIREDIGLSLTSVYEKYGGKGFYYSYMNNGRVR